MSRLCCSKCGRPPRDNYERVALERGELCLRPACAPPQVPDNYPIPRWAPGEAPGAKR